MKRYIEMPQEIIDRAMDTLTYKDALDAMFSRLIKEVAANKIQVLAFWNESEKTLNDIGVVKGPDETLNFDFITQKFFITKQG